MSTPNDIARLRAQLQRLKNDTLTSNTSLSNINATIEEKIAAVNQGVGAVAASVLNVSSSLSVSLEQASTALQASLEANAGAILILSSSTSSSISQSAALIQSGLTSLGGSLYDVSSSLSTSLSESAQALRLSLAANASAVIQLSQSTSMSLSQSAAALREGLVAVAGTVYDVSSSLSTSVEESGRLLRDSLTNLVNQNSQSFKSRLDSLDGELDGVVNNITVITGSWDDYTTAVNNINNYTSSVKIDINTLNGFKANTETFNADIKRKTDALTQKQSDEDSYATSSLSILASSVVENLKILNLNLPSKGIQYPTPDNYWAYTVAYPIGREPFKIKSYSYMGTKTGNKYWNLEDVITYTKRLYGVKENSAGGYDANNTMLNNGATTQNSELYLKADQIIIEKGRTNLTSPTLTIIGETSETNGYGLDQGQLFIRDEDASTSGLQIGYRWQSGVAEYGRIQAVNSAGGTDLYINPAGGSVRINRINNHFLENGSIELNYYGNGPRNTFIDFHSNYTENQTDYESRIIRWSGVDGMMEIINNGNGGIRNKVDSGTGNIFDWYAGSTKLMHLSSTGQLRTTEINIEADRIELAARDNDNSDLALNYLGYNGGTTRFRNVRIYDGKQSTIALFEGSTKKVYKNNGVFWDTLSDIRVKENIRNYTKGLEYINKINPVMFDYNGKGGLSTSKDNISIVAQEIIDIVPECVSKYKTKLNKDDIEDTELYSFNPNSLFYIMINSIKELSQKNDYLEKKLEEKEKQLQDILSRLTTLESK